MPLSLRLSSPLPFSVLIHYPRHLHREERRDSEGSGTHDGRESDRGRGDREWDCV